MCLRTVRQEGCQFGPSTLQGVGGDWEVNVYDMPRSTVTRAQFDALVTTQVGTYMALEHALAAVCDEGDEGDEDRHVLRTERFWGTVEAAAAGLHLPLATLDAVVTQTCRLTVPGGNAALHTWLGLTDVPDAAIADFNVLYRQQRSYADICDARRLGGDRSRMVVAFGVAEAAMTMKYMKYVNRQRRQ